MERKNLNIEIKSFDAASRLLTGYASTFGPPADEQGDIIVAGAFGNSIQKIRNGGIPLLDSHKADSEHVLGTVIDAIEDSHGLLITAKLADTPNVEEIRQKLIQGHLNKMSIGFRIEAHNFKQFNGVEYRYITEANLFEISVVPIPANDRAEILSVKASDTEAVAEEVIEAVEEAKETNEGEPTAKVEEVTEEAIKPKELQEDGVRADEATENASECETPEIVSDAERQSLEYAAELIEQSLNQTRRKHNGK